VTSEKKAKELADRADAAAKVWILLCLQSQSTANCTYIYRGLIQKLNGLVQGAFGTSKVMSAATEVLRF
jgi:hypothetical protein